MTFKEFKTEFDAKIASMSDEQLVDALRKVGCKFIGDEELESQEQYKESLKHDY